MNNVALVEIVDSLKHLPNRLRGVFLRELAIVANPVKQLAAHGQVGDNVEFILAGCQMGGLIARGAELTLDSNQSTKWTM